METNEISQQITDSIATITFSSKNHNALALKQLRDLSTRIQSLGQDQSIKVIILKSAGDRTFCAGANLKELSSIREERDAHTFFRGFADVINAMRTCGKIIIGRIQGKAVGGGVGLIASCDYILATKWASVKLSEISIGIGPLVIEPSIRRKIGISKLSSLALNPEEWKTAEWCLQAGLYQKIFDDTDQLDEYLIQMIGKYKSYGRESLQAMKQVIWEGTDHWSYLLDERAALSGKLLLSPFTQKSIAKYKS